MVHKEIAAITSIVIAQIAEIPSVCFYFNHMTIIKMLYYNYSKWKMENHLAAFMKAS